MIDQFNHILRVFDPKNIMIELIQHLIDRKKTRRRNFMIMMVLFLFAHRMTEKKKEAEAAIDLMSVQYERICNDEEKRKGLIIVQAKYGKFESDTPQG